MIRELFWKEADDLAIRLASHKNIQNRIEIEIEIEITFGHLYQEFSCYMLGAYHYAS
jgi:hypothetical protein